MDKQERVDLIREAQVLIEEAYLLVQTAVEGTSEEAHTEACGYCGLTQAMGNGNPYDENLDNVIEALEALEG